MSMCMHMYMVAGLAAALAISLLQKHFASFAFLT